MIHHVKPPAGLEWAYGCEHCEYGVVYETPGLKDGPAPLYWARAIGYQLGGVLFCACRAGRNGEARARRLLSELSDAGATRRKEGRGLTWKEKPSPDYVPGAWWKYYRALIDNAAPTVHGAAPQKTGAPDSG